MRLKSWHAIVLVSIAVLAVYYPALSAPLNSVDDVNLVNDLLNRGSFSWQDCIFPSSISYYRPLINTSFILDHFLWNLETPFLHLENLLLHWLNTVMLFFLVRQVALKLDQNYIYAPFVAALLFGVHPINAEAVIWVAGRADLLATFFILLTLICAFMFLKKQSLLFVACTALVFFVGCLAKETVLFVWPGLLLIGYLSSQQTEFGPTVNRLPLRQAMLPALACLFSIAGYFILRYIALHGRDLGLRQVEMVMSSAGVGVKAPVESIDPFWFEKLEKGLTVAGFYARKVVQPLPLNFGIIEVQEVYFWPGLLLLLLCLYSLIHLSWPRVFFLTAVSLGSIALLVSFGGISWTPVAERYMYAPTALTTGCVALTGARYLRGKSSLWQNTVSLVLCAVVCIAAVGVYQRALVWQDNVTLYEDTVEKSPSFHTAHNELARAYMKRGESERAYEILRNLDVPDFQASSLNKVSVWIHDGEYDRARSFLIERLETPSAYDRIVLEKLVDVAVLMSQNSTNPSEMMALQEEALYYLEDLWRRTREPFYLYRLGRQQMMMSRRDEARQTFARAYQLFPEDSIYKKPAGKLAEVLE